MSIGKRLLSYALMGLSFSSITIPTVLAGAEVAYSQNRFQKLWQRFISRPSRYQRPATLGRGGANRDSCPFTEQRLTALVPTVEESSIAYLEQTTEISPTWYFFVPYRFQIETQAEFMLLDESEEVVYQETVLLSDTPGIVELSLPEGTELSVAQSYRWLFSVICTADNRSNDVTVNGWIERIDSETLSPDFSALSEKERLLAYADHLIWFDALHLLIEERKKDPLDGELEILWQDLLSTLNLDSSVELVQSGR